LKEELLLHESEFPGACRTLVELLQYRAQLQKEQRAFLFLSDGEAESDSLTYGELDRNARLLATHLADVCRPGARAVLMYPPGLSFISSFFGCLYAGVIAVPAYPPRPNRSLDRIRSVIRDAQPTVLLGTQDKIAEIHTHLQSCGDPIPKNYLGTDELKADSVPVQPLTTPNSATTAFLQYTSGSTADPKGVMVTHDNLLTNLRDLDLGYRHTAESRMVSWLPVFHDLGLIYGVLQPLYGGFTGILLPPGAFLQRPLRWLQAISRYRGTHSAAPNFAYEMCLNRIKPTERAGLDLSSWVMALNAAEPVRAETLRRFCETFASCGFRSKTFCPSYGLAEATLKATATRPNEAFIVVHVDEAALADGRVKVSPHESSATKTLVGCGRSEIGTVSRIVNPETRQPCSLGEVGEIWLSGRTLAKGYWNRPEETAATFGARLADGTGPFLRTGDLGFIHDDSLFIAGRIKDLLIIRGRNHYPQDLELTVARAHPALKLDGGTAFSIEAENEERVVVVQEVERSQRRTCDFAEIVGAVRRAVAEEHDLELFAFVLVEPNGVPRTSSGKIQRQLCRRTFLAGTLQNLGVWRQTDGNEDPVSAESVVSPPQMNKEAVLAWLASRLAARLGVPMEEIRPREPFARYGLGSADVVALSGELEHWLQRRLPPTLLYDHPTPESLATHLTEETAAQIVERATVEAEAVAIIGFGCRFPGAENPEAFRRLLRGGVDAVSETPPARGHWAALYDARPGTPGKLCSLRGGFLPRLDEFDAEFFGISPREAEALDPQQRLWLEVSWEALEHAGLDPLRLAGNAVGVYCGISGSDYARALFAAPSRLTAYAGTGGALSLTAGRLSFLLDLRGPSLAVDTACSSSLTAVHLACRSLQAGECALALAGGVNLLTTPDLSVVFSSARMLSPGGCCRTFDAEADGYVRGEGCGVVVLKRLADALRDGDSIWAVIQGSAVNQDGRTNGLTAPSGPAQQAVVRAALQRAGIAAATLDYVETHGTGTPLGDPLEFNALKELLAPGRPATQPCAVGSVKTNIGHLEAAAGIAGLLKTVLMMQEGLIYPHLHLRKLNPLISLDDAPVYIPTAPMVWPRGAHPRRAGISAFGFGGTNAHVILTEAPSTTVAVEAHKSPVEHLLALSAKTEAALRAMADAVARKLTENPPPRLCDVCFTASVSRTSMPFRLAVIADSIETLCLRLKEFVRGEAADGVFSGRAGCAAVQTVVLPVCPDTAAWRAAAEAFVRGGTLAFSAVYPPGTARKIVLPTYPFERRRFWFDSVPEANAVSCDQSGQKRHPWLREKIEPALLPKAQIWTGEVRFSAKHWLQGHRVAGTAVFPGAGFVELLTATGLTGGDFQPLEIACLQFERPLLSPRDGCHEFQVGLSARKEGAFEAEVFSRPTSEKSAWTRHACGQLRLNVERFSNQKRQDEPETIEHHCRRMPRKESGEAFYHRWAARGNHWQGLFSGIQVLHQNEREAWARVELPATAATESFVMHPALLDAAVQTLAALAPAAVERPFVGRSVERLRILERPPQHACWSLATIDATSVTADSLRGDVRLFDDSGRLFMEIIGLEFAFLSSSVFEKQSTAPFYQVCRCPLVPAVAFNPNGPRSFLLIGGGGFAGKVRQALEAHGIQVACVADLLPAHKHKDLSSVEKIVDLRAAASVAAKCDAAGAVDAGVECLSAAADLFRSIAALPAVSRPQVALVTRNAEQGSSGAMLRGFCRSLAAEYAGIWGGMADIDADVAEKVAAQRLAEWLLNSNHEDQVAVGNEGLYGLRLERLTVGDGGEMCPRSEGAFLITGGLGGLGLLTARRLVERGARRLILAGRTGLPPRDRWEDVAADERQRRSIRAVKELEALGAVVEVLALDVADERALSACLEKRRRAGLPSVCGIVHAAGAAEVLPVEVLTRDQIRGLLRAKVGGAAALARAFAAEPLEFLVFYSSVAALLPSPGLAVYAAANEFLNALARELRSQSCPATSIAWGPWAEVGMAAEHLAGMDFSAVGLRSLEPEEGLRYAGRLWRADVAAPVVMPMDWGVWCARNSTAATRPFFAAFSSQGAVFARSPESAAVAPPVEPEVGIPQRLRLAAARVLKLDAERIEFDQSLNALGLDSLMALELRGILEMELGVQVPIADLTRGLSLRDLSARIASANSASPPTKTTVAPAPAAESPTEFSLTPAQKAQWFLHRLNPQSAAYHVSFSARIRSLLDLAALRRAFEMIVARHAALRTVYRLREGEVMQQIQPNGKPNFETQSASNWDEPALRQAVVEAYRRPFDLENGPVFRVCVFSRGPEDHVLLAVVHHIACDGWSLWLLLEELKTLYAVETGGVGEPLPLVSHTFADFAAAQSELLSSAEGERLGQYWQTQLAGAPTTLEFPTDFPRPSVPSGRGASVPFRLSAKLTARLKSLAREHNTTLFTLLLAAYQAWLHRHTGQDELLVGSPTTGRTRTDDLNIVGDIVNPVVLRADFHGEPSFAAHLAAMRETVLGALAHQAYPFSVLVEKLQPQRDPGRSPLFQADFVLQKPQRAAGLLTLFLSGRQDGEVEWGGLRLTPFEMIQQEGQFDLVLEMVEADAELYGWFKYGADLFRSETAERWTEQFQILLEAVADAPHTLIADLPLSAENKVPTTAVATIAVETPSWPTMHAWFEAAAKRMPAAPAVSSDTKTLTYAELNARANRLAHGLLAQGVRPRDRIALCLNRSVDFPAAALAVLKAGAAYVPLDPAYPEQRLRLMLKDAEPRLLLTRSDLLPRLPDDRPLTICLDRDVELWGRLSAENPSPTVGPDDPAYLIYTSGSSGMPKGVPVSHHNLVYSTHARFLYYPSVPEAFLLPSSFAFDSSVAGLFWTLCGGGCLVVPTDESAQDPAALSRLVIEQRISHFLVLPSLYSLLMERLSPENAPAMRAVIVAGEACPRRLVKRHYARLPEVELYNEYGPTEGTVWATVERCRSDEQAASVPIGRPIPHAEVLVLDRRRRPTPVGVPGELYLGGAGLVGGYWNRPDLTAERFVPHPLCPGRRLYKTGDRARFLSDGRLEFLGRMDDQVKLRGYRIEFGEIEAALCALPNIQEAAVALREDRPGEPRLAAYLVAADGQQPTSASVRSALRERLPEYMIPSTVVLLEKMPQLPNGKLNRRALPPPPDSASESVRSVPQPQSELERVIARIWTDLLHVSNVGLGDNFFELGGHSLLLARVQSRLRDELKRDIPMVELFAHPTVAALAAHLEGRSVPTDLRTAAARAEGRAERRGLLVEQRRRRSAQEDIRG
jgi:amino acid adenylation domain-containing protein